MVIRSLIVIRELHTVIKYTEVLRPESMVQLFSKDLMIFMANINGWEINLDEKSLKKIKKVGSFLNLKSFSAGTVEI